jgi:hypothetical protein
MKHFYPLLITAGIGVFTILGPDFAKADIFGGDVAVLAQILQQTIQQLAVMQQTLKIAKGDSDLLAKVNRDIESALGEIHAIQEVVRETNSIGKTKDPVELLNRLRAIYGSIPRLGNTRGLEFTDNVVGTAYGVDNDTHIHAKTLDSAAIKLQSEAMTASPGRAQQLTAQSQTTVIHSLAQIERNGGTVARIQATDLAMRNNQEKNHLESFDQSYSGLMNSNASTASDLTLGEL